MDKRLIDKVSPYKNELLTKLEAVVCTSKNNPTKRELTIVAQHVQQIEPLLVKTTAQGFVIVDYERLSVALLSEICDLKFRLEQVEKELSQARSKKKAA